MHNARPPSLYYAFPTVRDATILCSFPIRSSALCPDLSNHRPRHPFSRVLRKTALMYAHSSWQPDWPGQCARLRANVDTLPHDDSSPIFSNGLHLYFDIVHWSYIDRFSLTFVNCSDKRYKHTYALLYTYCGVLNEMFFFYIKIHENSISSQLIVKAGMFTFDKEKNIIEKREI